EVAMCGHLFCCGGLPCWLALLPVWRVAGWSRARLCRVLHSWGPVATLGCPLLLCGGPPFARGPSLDGWASLLRRGSPFRVGALRARGRACIMWGMTTSTTGAGGSFWTKPLGQIIAERKGRAYYRPAGFGTAKTGLIELKSDGRMIYTTL